jgi:ABC-type polysaccharide/polyol phosphate export permease
VTQAVYTSTSQQAIGRVLPDIIRNRGLLWDLIWKDLRARYRNAVMGFVWAVLQPLLMMLVLYFVFGVVFAERLAVGDGAANEPPRPVPLLCGLIFWQFFAACMSRTTVSLIENAELIKKVYFPREIIPLAAMGNCLVNLAIGFAVLIVLHLALGGAVGFGLLGVGLIFAIEAAFIVGLALLCSSLNVYYRDVGYGVEVLLTFGFYATPVFYSLSLVREKAAGHSLLLKSYMLNPLVQTLTAFRQSFLENRMPDLAMLAWPFACAFLSLLLGIIVFRRLAPTIADRL